MEESSLTHLGSNILFKYIHPAHGVLRIMTLSLAWPAHTGFDTVHALLRIKAQSLAWPAHTGFDTVHALLRIKAQSLAWPAHTGFDTALQTCI